MQHVYSLMSASTRALTRRSQSSVIEATGAVICLCEE